MSRKYYFGNQNHLHFLTFTVIGWIDVFTRNEYRQVVVNSIKYCQQNKGLEVYGYVIMPSHIHMIIGRNKELDLEDIVRDMKSYISRAIRKMMYDTAQVHESRKEWMMEMMQKAGLENSNNKDFQFWQQHNKPIELWSSEVFNQKLNYIHNNPVEAGFVDEPDSWLYSSARNYSGKPSYIDILYP